MISFLSTIFLATFASANMSFEPCGGLINTTHLEILPTHVIPNEDMTIVLKIANGHAEIDDALTYYFVHAEGLYEHPQVDNLCDVVKCPIRMGRSELRIPLFVPDFRGLANIQFRIMKRDLTPLICINMEVSYNSWLQAIFGGIKRPMLPPPSPIFTVPASYSLSKE